MSDTVVIKVGGSLLDWSKLPVTLSEYLRKRAHERLLLIVGGGAIVDVIRTLDRAHQLGEERSHELALHALDLTAQVLITLIPGLCVIDDPEERTRAWERDLIPILAPRRFLERDERSSPDPLAHSWNVTSDAIAARVAERIGAKELVLLKSTPIPDGDPVRCGVVDPAFFDTARALDRVFYLNLRDPLPMPMRLSRSLDDHGATERESTPAQAAIHTLPGPEDPLS